MKYFIVFSLLFISLVHAGDERGNGGDALVCRNKDGVIKSAKILDFYEAESFRQTLIYDNAKDVRDFIDRNLSFLRKYDEHFYNQILPTVSKLLEAAEEYDKNGSTRIDDILFVEDTLNDIPDSKHLIFKKGCKVEQLAIRVKKYFKEDPGFIIQKEIWDYLSIEDKGGLIQHEAIFEYLINEFEHTNSIYSRYFNSKISSQKFLIISYDQYLEILRESGINFIMNGRIKLKTENVNKVNNDLWSIPIINDSRKIHADKENGVKVLTQNDRRLLVDKAGKINDELTRRSNPRTLFFQVRMRQKDSNVTLTINEEIVCNKKNISITKIGRGSDVIDYLYQCTIELLTGKNQYKLVIDNNNKRQRNYLYYWTLTPTPIIDKLIMERWFWSLNPEEIKGHLGTNINKKISKKKKYTISDRFILY